MRVALINKPTVLCSRLVTVRSTCDKKLVLFSCSHFVRYRELAIWNLSRVSLLMRADSYK